MGFPVHGMQGRPEPALQVLIPPYLREAFQRMWVDSPYPFTAGHWKSVPPVRKVLDLIEMSNHEVVDAWRQQRNGDALMISFRRKEDHANLVTTYPLP